MRGGWREGFALMMLAGVAPGADTCENRAHPVSAGWVRFCPSAFVQFMGTARSNRVNPSVSTDFGSIPLRDTPAQVLGTFRPSRISLDASGGLGSDSVKLYYESDFLDDPGNNPFRLRQLWGEYRRGRWSVLGGKAWSLVRLNHKGVSSESDVFDLDVLDPGYLPGVLGSRVNQVRVVARAGSTWQIAAAFEDGGRFVAKAARDKDDTHFEAIGLVGTDGQAGAGPVVSMPLPAKLRFTTQHFVTKGGGEVALELAPAKVWTYTGFAELEWAARDGLEVHGSGGLVYAARSEGNRRFWGWALGASQEIWKTRLVSFSIEGQYTHVNRATWTSGRGTLRYAMVGLKLEFAE